MKLNKEQIDAGAIALTQATKPPTPRRPRGRQVKTKNGIKLVRTSVQLEQWHVDAIALIAKTKNITSSEVLRELLDDILR